MSDPKDPVDPLAQTQAALPQSTVATAHPYAAPQPGAPSYAQQLAAHQAAQAQHPAPPPAKRSPALWVIAAMLVTGAAAGIGFAVTKMSKTDSGDRGRGGGSSAGAVASAGGSSAGNGNGGGRNAGAGGSNAGGGSSAGGSSAGGSNAGGGVGGAGAGPAGSNGGGAASTGTGGSNAGGGVGGAGAATGPAAGSNGGGAASTGTGGSNAGAGSASGPPGSALVVDVLAQRHVTLDPGIARELHGKRIAADAFVIGVDANEIGIGPDAAATFVAHDFEGATRAGGGSAQMSTRVIGGKVMQYASASLEAMVNSTRRTYLVTEIHASENGVDVIRAWMWSRAVPDQLAYDASKHGALPDPARIDDVHGDAALEAKVRAALNSRAKYIAMLDDDGFSFGSAGETLSGPRVKAGFRAMTAEFRLHDGLRLVTVHPGYAFAAANVDFTNRYGTETFRVLLALGDDNGKWKIVQGHWSNGFPIPGAP